MAAALQAQRLFLTASTSSSSSSSLTTRPRRTTAAPCRAGLRVPSGVQTTTASSIPADGGLGGIELDWIDVTTSTSSIGSAPADRNTAVDKLRAVAEAALAGAVYAPIGAATYYHSNAVYPWWAPSLARIGRIGAHIFYGWRSALASALSFRRDYAGVEPVSTPLLAATSSPAPVVMAAEPTGVTVHRGTGLPGPASTVPPGDAVADAPATVAVTMGVRVHRNHGASSGPMIVAIGPEEGPGDDRS